MRSISKKDVGLEQSFARDLACWVAEATVYAATQAYLSTSQSSVRSETKRSKSAPAANEPQQSLHHGLLGWLQELSPTAGWDANRVIQSSSFNVLLNLVAGLGTMNLRDDVEQELYRVVGLLSTNPQCATAIVERATRYGKQALWNLAQAHDVDSRLGASLRQMVETDSDNARFGAANLVSLVSLAVAATELPDEYLEFTYWALQRASSTPKAAKLGASDWRKTLFGDDRVAKTRRKLVSNKGLWDSLQAIRDRPLRVQLQAARMVQELSEDSVHAPKALKRHPEFLDVLMNWMNSDNNALTVAGVHTAANLGVSEDVREELITRGALDLLRSKFTPTCDSEMVTALLRAVRVLATPNSSNQGYALDGYALSFMNDSDEEHPLHHDDLVHPDSILRHQYIDGWIELFTTFLRDGNEAARAEAALCLQQLATNGSHRDQGIQEWLIAVLDGVLESVPVAVSASSTSVRAAKSRTRPIAGRLSDSKGYEASHAKALRALAFVVSRKECQEALARRGGVQLLKILLRSESLEVQRETARVLANLFTCDDMESSFASFAKNDAELTTVLDAWTQSSDIKLRSLAHRARSNRRYQHNRLQNADDSDVKYLDGVHPLHFSTSPTFYNGNQSSSALEKDEGSIDYDVDVVFIHGLLGCPYETWVCGEDDSTMWAQEWLLEDLKAEGHNPRLLSIGYDSQLLASESTWKTMCFQETSQDVLKKLRAARVGDRPVVFVTHSLGGVLLKQVLLEAEDSHDDSSLIDSVNGVLFYGVPHHGSPIAQTIQTFRPRTLGIEQHPVTEHLHGTPHLKMLNDWAGRLFEEKGISALSVGESSPCKLPVIGVDALVVPATSANPGFGDFVTVADSTHIDVCKPQSKLDERYKLARQFILKHTPKLMGVE
ncbi:hypothetical protein ATCC90586_002592 [Pythium insidiosum]|nr:hypothetical protein ATCC90586_002592 [Pythium insidiosum]